MPPEGGFGPADARVDDGEDRFIAFRRPFQRDGNTPRPAIREAVLEGVGDNLVDDETERKRLVGREAERGENRDEQEQADRCPNAPGRVLRSRKAFVAKTPPAARVDLSVVR